MNRSEHYREAERLIGEVDKTRERAALAGVHESTAVSAMTVIAMTVIALLANVHASLAAADPLVAGETPATGVVFP